MNSLIRYFSGRNYWSKAAVILGLVLFGIVSANFLINVSGEISGYNAKFAYTCMIWGVLLPLILCTIFGLEKHTNYKHPHELAEKYDHLIKWHQERYRRIFVFMSSALGIFLVASSQFLTLEYPEKWIEILAVVSGTISFGFLYAAASPFIETIQWRKKREIALSYPAQVSVSVERTHENVKEWLTNPSEESLKPKLFKRLCARYCELDSLPTDEILNRLKVSGVWNANNKWYEKGRTLDEGLLMTIYTRRADKETVGIEAAKATHKKVSHEAAIAPDLQIRKQAEQQKEAVERELEELNKEPDGFIDWELDDLEGNAGLHLRGDYVVRVTFNLPSGVYKITVTDTEKGQGRKSQKLLRMNGEPQELEINPPIKSGQILIANEAGKAETISLD